MFRLLFYAVLLILFARAVWRFWDGLVAGLGGRTTGPGTTVPQRGVQMVRDPVCGTFVMPDRAVTMPVGGHVVHFCSVGCRDKYRAGAA